MSIDLMQLFTPVNGRFPSLAEVEARSEAMLSQMDDELIPGRDDLADLPSLRDVVASMTPAQRRLADEKLARMLAEPWPTVTPPNCAQGDWDDQHRAMNPPRSQTGD